MLCIPRDDPAPDAALLESARGNRRCFHGDWFLTGDYARLDADGYLWFLGRRTI